MNIQDKAVFDKMVATASQLNVKQLKESIVKDATKPELPSVVFESLLSALECKITEEEFVAFCEEIY